MTSADELARLREPVVDIANTRMEIKLNLERDSMLDEPERALLRRVDNQLERLARRVAELERQLAEAQEQARQALNDWHKAMDELAEMRGQLAQTQERSGDEQDPEWQEIPPLDPTKLPRCPKCRTYGHEHRKDCPYVGSGMNHHVYPARAAGGEHG